MIPINFDYSKRVDHFALCISTYESILPPLSQLTNYPGTDLLFLKNVLLSLVEFCILLQPDEPEDQSEMDYKLVLYGEQDAELLSDFELSNSWTSISTQSPQNTPTAGRLDGIVYWVRHLSDESIRNCLKIISQIPADYFTSSFIIFEEIQGQEENLQWRAAREGIILIDANTGNLTSSITLELQAHRAIVRRLVHSILPQRASRELALKPEILRKLDQAIEASLENGAQGVEAICAILPYSRSQLSRRIRQLTGLSLSHYINRYKLTKAGIWLQLTDWSIGRIACELGYSSQQYFCKLFREQYELSPSDYRKIKTAGETPQ